MRNVSVRPIPLSRFRADVWNLYTAGGRAPKTREQIDHALRLAELAGAKVTTDLTTATMATVILQRGADANPYTNRGILRRLKRACSIAQREGYLDRQPDWASLWPRCPKRRSKAHTAEQVVAFLGYLYKRRELTWFDRRLCALGWLVSFTGLRKQESLSLAVEDLDLARGFAFVWPRNRLKTDASAAPVPLPDLVVPVLADWAPHCGGEWLFPGARSGTPWIGGSPGQRPKDRLQQAGEAAGVKGLGFQTLRHSYATSLLISGTPEWAIQRILRHTTPITTDHYLHPTDVEVRRHVQAFRYDQETPATSARSA